MSEPTLLAWSEGSNELTIEYTRQIDFKTPKFWLDGLELPIGLILHQLDIAQIGVLEYTGIGDYHVYFAVC